MIIKSSTSLRNEYGELSALAHESREPIYITKNGEGDLVMMSIDAFEQWEETIRLREKLKLAEASRVSGEKTYSIEESRKALEAIYRQIGNVVFVYHIVDGRANYPRLLSDLPKDIQ